MNVLVPGTIVHVLEYYRTMYQVANCGVAVATVLALASKLKTAGRQLAMGKPGNQSMQTTDDTA